MHAFSEDICENKQRGRPRAFSEAGAGRLPVPLVLELRDALLRALNDYEAVHSAMRYQEARDALRQAQEAVAAARRARVREAATRKGT